MKRLITLSIMFTATLSAQAQLKLYELKTKKPAQTTYTFQLPKADSTFRFDFAVLNEDASKAKGIRVVRTIEKLAAGQSTNFCFAKTCYPPPTNTSSPEKIAAGGTIPAKAGQFGLQADLNISNVSGTTIVRYRIENVRDLTDTASVTLIYKTSASADRVTSPVILSAQLSPNPANTQTLINVNLVKAVQTSVTIYNAQGTPVFTRNYGILNGNQKLMVNTSSLLPGLYTVALTAGEDKQSITLQVEH